MEVATPRGMIFVQHQSRTFGMQIPIYETDMIRVYTPSRHEIAALSGAIVLRLIEHYLAGVALEHAIAHSVTDGLQLPPTPYRRALVHMDQPVRDMRAVARRSRKR